MEPKVQCEGLAILVRVGNRRKTGNMRQTDLNTGRVATVGVTGWMGARREKFRNVYGSGNPQAAGSWQPGTVSRFEKQKEKVLIFLTTAFLLSFLASTAMASPVITPSGDPGRTPSNPFDYSNLTVTQNSATYSSGSDIRDVFGGSFSTLEAPGRTIFADHPGQVTTYDIFFTTNSAVSLAGYSLFLEEDGPGSLNRSATNFELLANGNVVSNVALAGTGSNYAMRFGSDAISVSDTFSPVTATTFEAIFTSNIGFANGIRVLGFQAEVGSQSGLTPNPEPSTISLALLAGLAFAAFYRRRIVR